jgi:hypothetical protein
VLLGLKHYWLIDRSDKNAEVAHLVEHDLAKVGVAGSSPVFRSVKIPFCTKGWNFLFKQA